LPSNAIMVIMSSPEASEVHSDDSRYLQQAIDAARGDPSFERMVELINLLSQGISLTPRLQWADVFPNDISTVACLSRSYRQLRSAVTLMMNGYCPEARVMLRGAYESSALARMLAKNLDSSDKWLRRQHWFPDREVREWFANTGPNRTSSPDEIIETYGRFYRETSRWAHPTAISCLPLVRGDEYGPRPQLGTVFIEEEFHSCVMEIAATALFSCFALRNSAAGEKAIDPQWRQRLYELAPEITGSEMPHLERDWATEQQQYEELQQKVQSSADLVNRLRRDPRSWDNLKASKPAVESDGSS
jgi:hypothetical protein